MRNWTNLNFTPLFEQLTKETEEKQHRNKRIEQLIYDIEEQDWFCDQEDGESNMEDWEKELILEGLRCLIS